MTMKIIIGTVILIMGILWYTALNHAPHEEHESEVFVEETNAVVVTETPDHKMYTVTYTDAGFVQNAIAIKAGDMVAYKNQSKNELMVTFGEHENHDASPDKKAHPSIKSGDTTQITFPTAGTFNYHNHHNDEMEGSVVVE